MYSKPSVKHLIVTRVSGHDLKKETKSSEEAVVDNIYSSLKTNVTDRVIVMTSEYCTGWVEQ